VIKRVEAFRERASLSEGLRWVPTENLHITTFFIGNVPVEMIDNLISLLTISLASQHGFEMEFRGFSFGPKASSPRMIWGRFHKSDAFRELVSLLDTSIGKVLPGRQNRKSPIPHITLARIKSPGSVPSIQFEPSAEILRFHVGKLVLWESETRPEGPKYTALNSFFLPDEKVKP
jgi:2'-5' RNA ligase